MNGELQRIKLYKELNPNELSSEQFQKLEVQVKNHKPGKIGDEYLDFKLWCYGLPSRQETFANFIAKKLSKKEGAKILEVGCGRTARLSRFLSEKGFKITCIDPVVEITSTANIEVIKDKFDYKKFDLSKYDYVVAEEPCDATEHVVRACVEQKVPFMIVLCATPHKLISGGIHKDVFEWYEYLVNISKEAIKLRYLDWDPFTTTPLLRSNKF